MANLFTLIFIISCVGIWYFIKKSPNKKNRNIAIGVALISVLIIGGSSPSSKEASEKNQNKEEKVNKIEKSKSSKTKVELPLSLNSTEFETNDKGIATITGKTKPKSKVSVGAGIIGDSTEADSDGNFSLEYELSGEKNKDITIYSSLDDEKANSKVTIKPNAQILAAAEQKKAADKAAKEQADQKKAEEASLPAEYKSALRKAESYSSAMHMSKTGIYDQLTSEAGEQFSAEAAQYAIDNMKADFSNNALKKAESYSKTMSMSKQGVYDQLVSESGEQFTPEEAQHAIDNLSADFNENALKKAQNYQESMAMSPEAIRDQLTSEHGEQFTPEEADYAIQHLNQ